LDGKIPYIKFYGLHITFGETNVCSVTTTKIYFISFSWARKPKTSIVVAAVHHNTRSRHVMLVVPTKNVLSYTGTLNSHSSNTHTHAFWKQPTNY